MAVAARHPRMTALLRVNHFGNQWCVGTRRRPTRRAPASLARARGAPQSPRAPCLKSVSAHSSYHTSHYITAPIPRQSQAPAAAGSRRRLRPEDADLAEPREPRAQAHEEELGPLADDRDAPSDAPWRNKNGGRPGRTSSTPRTRPSCPQGRPPSPRRRARGRWRGPAPPSRAGRCRAPEARQIDLELRRVAVANSIAHAPRPSRHSWSMLADRGRARAGGPSGARRRPRASRGCQSKTAAGRQLIETCVDADAASSSLPRPCSISC